MPKYHQHLAEQILFCKLVNLERIRLRYEIQQFYHKINNDIGFLIYKWNVVRAVKSLSVYTIDSL